MSIQTASEIVIWTIFSLSWIFVAEHTILCLIERRPWWRTMPGWIFTTAVASLAIVFTFLAAADRWPQLAVYHWYQWAYIVSFGLVAAAIIGKIVLRAWLFAHREK